MNKRNFSVVLVLAIAAAIFLLAYHGLITGAKTFVHDTIIWYASYHYYVESISGGHFPYWNPYMSAGTYFYPNVSIYGLLDPLVLIGVFLTKIFGVSVLTSYNYFRLARLFVFFAGTLCLYRYVIGSLLSATIAACCVFFSVAATSCSAPLLDEVFLFPYILYFILLFLEDPHGPKRYLYLFSFVLVSGIMMNVFIPSYFLFNLAAFLVAWFVLNRRQLSSLASAFHDWKLISMSLFCILLLILLSAPPLTVYLKDASSSGELFPMQRIVQKNNGNFKKIMASDIGSTALSDKFVDQRGIFSSYGNMVNMITPDFLNVLYKSEKNKFTVLKMAENNTYIGIIPFIFALIGILYVKSRYRVLFLIMLAVISANMFSFYGHMDVKHNFLQRIFDEIFPPLKMVEVRQNFGGFFLLYLGILSGMGLTVFFDNEKFRDLVSRRAWWIISFCLLITGIKIFITEYFWEESVYTTPYDLFVLLQLLFFAACIFIFSRWGLKLAFFQAVVIIVIFADLHIYNRYMEVFIMQDSRPIQSLIDVGNANKAFQYFREPLPAPQGMAFGEDVIKIKGAITYGNNHTMFTTKRYYDVLTHVPLQNQFRLSGIVFPVIGFFPSFSVKKVADRNSLIGFYESAPEEDISRYLFIEDPASSSLQKNSQELRPLSEYEDVPWLQPFYINRFYSDYLMKNEDYMRAIRNTPERFLSTQDFSVTLAEFSPNTIRMNVKNMEDGYLYYNDGWSKYWEAYDGENKIPVMIANYNSKAVFLPRGEHTVRFVFNPIYYKFGLAAYYSGLLLVLAIIIVLALRKPA